MRVLAVADKWPPVVNAGAEVMLQSMLRDLVRRGHECTVACDRADGGSLDGVRVVRGGDLDHLAREHDVVISHLNVAPKAAKIAVGARRPFVQVVHNDRQLDPSSMAALVVWNSEWIRDRYRKWTGKSIVVRPPVALADYDIGRRNSTSGSVTLVNLARLKGARLFWELAQCQPDRHFLGVRGGYGDQIEPPKRLRNVEVLPHLPASRMRDEVYARTRVLLVPSQYESWGMVAVEAACAGIPVLANPTVGLVEALGSAGLFIDRRRPGEWKRTIEALDDPDFYRCWSDRARARAVELDGIARADLDGFHEHLLALTGA